MSSNAHDATDTPPTTPAPQIDTGEAFPGLPNHLVVAHILRSEFFYDPADFARLRLVSRAMRDTVTASGRSLDEPLDEKRAVKLGCLSAMEYLEREGRLSRKELLCEAAAMGGHLEKLKVLLTNG